jgi:putative DNA primase/helicase
MLAREMDADITEVWRDGADMLCLKVGFGLGKTREALRKAVQIAAEDEPVVYAVPTHELSGELLQRAEKEARDQKVDVRIEVWRGRERDDPDGGTMCRDIDAVRDVQGVGGDPQALVCRREINGTVQECPHFKTCGYQKQRRKSADIWLVAHHALFSRKPAAISPPALIIIDEGFWSAGLRGVEGHPVIVSEDQLGAIPDAKKKGGPLALFKSADLPQLRRALLAALDDHPLGPLERDRLIAAGLTADQCRAAGDMEWNRKIEVEVYPGMAPDKRRAAIAAVAVNKEVPRMARLWRELADVIDGIDRSGRVSLEEIEDKETGARYRGLRLQWADQIAEDWKAPTLHIDATLDIDLVRPYFPTAELRAVIEAEAPHQHIVQYPDRAFSKAMMKDPEAVERLWSWCKSYAIKKGGRWLFVVQKVVEDEIRARFKIPDFIDIAHHNAVEGRDEWKDVDGVINIGRTQPPPQAVEKIAGALTGREIGRAHV